MKLTIKEANETGSEMTIEEFMQKVKAIYAKHFPDSRCHVQLTKNLGCAIFIDFYLAKDSSEVFNGYAVNDMFQCGFDIFLEGRKELNDLMPDSMVLEAMKSVIKIRPENRYLAYDTVKIPFRKTTGNAKKILAALEKYVTRLASIVHEEYDKDTISDGYKDLLDSKIDRIR